MVRLILVRHGQVEWNRVERFRGRADLELNETGLWQAQALAKRIREDFVVDAIYSSPLRRARQTAEAIARETNLPIRVLDGLNDLDYGDWTGLTPEEVAVRYPQLYDLWLTKPEQLPIPGGETFDDVRRRALAAVEEVVSRHEGQTVVLASHKAVCKILVCSLMGLSNGSFWRIEQDNAALNLIRYETGRYVIELLNDTCHLKPSAHQ